MVARLALLALFCTRLCSAGRLFGVSQKAALVEINLETGVQKRLSPDLPYELQAQELSSIDDARGIYYIIGFNNSDRSPNLLGFDVRTGKKTTEVLLPLTEAPFVGLGQTLDVDPVSGDIMFVGRSSKVNSSNPQHIVARLFRHKGFHDYEILGHLSGLDVLGGSSTLDIDRRVMYIGMIASGTPPGPISINIHEFNIDTGATHVIYTNTSNGHFLNDLSYDHELKRIYGFGYDAAAKSRALVYIDPATGTWHDVGPVGTGHPTYTMEDGNLVALDWQKREFFSLLGLKVNVTTWKPSNKCDKTTCPPSNSSKCCYDPKSGKDSYACFNVPDCSRIADGSPFNISAPFHLVASDLDNGMTLPTHQPPVCSLTAQNCPWSIEFFNSL